MVLDAQGVQKKILNKTMETIFSSLTETQQKVYRLAMCGANLFISGGAGTGKSYLAKALIQGLKQAGKSVMVCAPTGVAATNIGGATIHRAFKMPAGICINEKSGSIRRRTSEALKATDTLLIDEISMCRVDLFDAVIASVRKVEKDTGKRIQIIVIGDFCQLPPVPPSNSIERQLMDTHYKRTMSSYYAFCGTEWNGCDFIPIILTDVLRQSDLEFIENLNRLRLGDRSCIDYFNSNAMPDELPNATWLYGTNADVDELNRQRLNELPGELFELPIVFFGDVQKTDRKDVAELLALKIGARVMITTNDTTSDSVDDIDPGPYADPSKQPRFYNGTYGTIVDVWADPNDPQYDSVKIKIDDGPVLDFFRKTYSVYDYDIDKDGHLIRVQLGGYKQIPIRIAYAATIHKSQGLTLSEANIDPYVQGCGQLYVALSRCRSIDGMHLSIDIESWNIQVDPDVMELYAELKLKQQSLDIDALIKQYEHSEFAPVKQEPKKAKPKRIPKPSTIKTTEQRKTKQKEIQEDKIIQPRQDALVNQNEEPKKDKEESKKNKGGKGGRPVRFPNGTKQIRFPIELVDTADLILRELYPSPSEGKYDTDKVENFINEIKDMFEK